MASKLVNETGANNAGFRIKRSPFEFEVDIALDIGGSLLGNLTQAEVAENTTQAERDGFIAILDRLYAVVLVKEGLS